jgi:hypothetical protein
MRRLPALMVVAWLVFGAAWFVQVHKNGATLGSGTLPGWEAFTSALDIKGEDGYSSATGWIARASACTNFLMLAAIALVLAGRRPTGGWFPIAFDVATVLNLWWARDHDRVDLRAGYWMWVGSFALMAIAVYLERKREAA